MTVRASVELGQGELFAVEQTSNTFGPLAHE